MVQALGLGLQDFRRYSPCSGMRWADGPTVPGLDGTGGSMVKPDGFAPQPEKNMGVMEEEQAMAGWCWGLGRKGQKEKSSTDIECVSPFEWDVFLSPPVFLS